IRTRTCPGCRLAACSCRQLRTPPSACNPLTVPPILNSQSGLKREPRRPLRALKHTLTSRDTILQMTLSNTLRKSCLIALLCLGVGTAMAEGTDGVTPVLDLESLQPTREQMIASLNTVELLRRHHYNRIRLDDALSSEVFDTYMRHLDPQRSLFTAADVRDFEAFRHKFDDLLLAGDLSVGFAMHTRQLQRADQRIVYAQRLLKDGVDKLDFTGDQSILIDREEAEWPKDEQALHALWRQQIKDEVLRLKLAGRDTDAIQDLLEKRYANQHKRLSQTRSEDIFQNYINALAQVYDPHTQYMSPENA